MLLLLPLLFPLTSTSQELSPEQAETFIRHLINKDDDIVRFIDPSEIAISKRLGIQYNGIDQKFLISYEIPEDINDRIQNGELSYTVIPKTLSEHYSKITLSIAKIDFQKDFFFYQEKLISPVSYYAKNWKRISSRHFRFIISDSTLFNSYCIAELEGFFVKMAGLLNITKERLEKIRTQKIYYFLCKDEDEIKQLTGFNTRGMYLVASDYVITTYNAHYHELLHLLMNFKLQNLPLYTTPFLQEGFAVAFGGRGGKEPNIILDIGLFIHKSELPDFSLLLSKKGFSTVDASLSYPLSGLYNLFLVEKIGMEEYLKIYRKYSGSAQQIENSKMDQGELPAISDWKDFIDRADFSSIGFEKLKDGRQMIFHNKSTRIYEDAIKYYFSMRDTLLIKTGEVYDGYQSKKYNEIFPNRNYNGEKYLILVNDLELSIYNLYTNNLIGSFVGTFSIPNSSIPIENGYYRFSIRKSVFDEDLKNVFILSD